MSIQLKLLSIIVCTLCVCRLGVDAFGGSHSSKSYQRNKAWMVSTSLRLQSSPLAHLHHLQPAVTFLWASSSDDDSDPPLASESAGDSDPVVLRAADADDIDGAIFEDLESGKPPEWMVMKELLGINIFTYILGGLIVFFLSTNFFLGPGWLGSVVGLPGTGSINEISDSLPDTIDLSSPEYRL